MLILKIYIYELVFIIHTLKQTLILKQNSFYFELSLEKFNF